MDPNPDYSYINGDIAFRLPSLKTKYQDLDYPKKTKQCPRETRVLAAFERESKRKKQNAFLKQENKLYSKLDGQVEALDESETRFFLRKLLDSESSTLTNTTDVVGYLVRELTEVSEAIEKSKDRLKKDTIKALRKVIAGVLHTMGQENLKRALASTETSFRYENYSKALQLNPRFLRELEKREPVAHTPHICRGCQVGGPLPIYLYPDREVYRTGGGFDCFDFEFELPVVKSDKALTIPKVPFSQSRGKLVGTRVHRLPPKRQVKITKARSFKFTGETESTMKSLQLPKVDESLASASSGDADLRSEPSFLTDPGYLNGRNGQLSSISSENPKSKDSAKEKVRFELSKENGGRHDSNSKALKCEKNENRNEKNENNQITNDNHDLRSNKNNNDDNDDSDGIQKISENQQRRNSNLQSLNKKLTNITKQPDDLTDDEKYFTRKLKLRMAIEPPRKRTVFNIVHNSTLLTDKPKESHETKTFAGRKVSTTKYSGFGKKKNSVDVHDMGTRSRSSTTGFVRRRETTSMTSSSADLSLRFSSSLSLTYPDTEATENGLPEFSLAGEKMKPSTRKSVTEKYSPPARKPKVVKCDSKLGKFRASVRKNEGGDLSNKSKTSMLEINSDLGRSLSSNEDTLSANIRSNSLTSGIESDMVIENQTQDSGSDFWESERSFLMTKEDQNKNDDDNDEDCQNEDDFGRFPTEFQREDSVLEKKRRRKGKRRRTLQFRMEPLSKYTLRRGSRTEDDNLLLEEDETMLDYAARYCIISLERLSKYENIFNTYSSLQIEQDEHNPNDTMSDNAEIIGETERQKTLLGEYEKLVFGMDVYQQRVSEADKKKLELLHKHQQAMEGSSNDTVDESQRKLLEATVEAFGHQINSVESRIKQFLGKIKKMMEKKKEIQDNLKDAGMENEKIEKLVKNTDFLERRFSKMKNKEMNIDNLSASLRDLNRNFSDEDFKFVTKILNLPKKESLDFKAFAVVAALSERVRSLDKSIKTLLREVDLATLERKLDKCKELYRLLAEENADHGSKLVPIDNLAVELRAGGIENDHQKSVIDKLDHHGQGFIDFLDFVLYVPLFLMIHDQIVSQPF